MKYGIEVNGAANILAELETAKFLNRPVNLEFIERQAKLLVIYMRSIDGDAKQPWHEVVQKN